MSNVKALIPNQLPAFVRNDKEKFVHFMQAYFDYLESTIITVTVTNSKNFTLGEYVKGAETLGRGLVKTWDSTNNKLHIRFTTETFVKVGERILGESSGTEATITAIQYSPIVGTENITKFRDIDRTVDDFVYNFKREFAILINENALVDKRLLYKNIKDFYQKKGSEDSYKFLFRILYGEEVDFYYPDRDILRPSDNTWRKRKFLRVNDGAAETSFKQRQIIGESSGATATVDNEVSTRIGTVLVKDLYLEESTIDGNFSVGEYVKTTDTGTVSRAVLYGGLTGITISTAGQDYVANTQVTVTAAATGGTGANVYIKTVGEHPLDDIEISTAGTGYANGDAVVFDNTGCEGENFLTANASVLTDGSGSITDVNIISKGRGYKKLPSLTITTGGGSSGALVAKGENVGGLVKFDIHDPGIQYIDAPTIEVEALGANNGIVTATVGTLHETSKEGYGNNKGFLSDKKFILDSVYYQRYSYVLKVNKSIDVWRDVVKRHIHPAGMVFFSQYSLEDVLRASGSLSTFGVSSSSAIISGEDIWIINNDLQSQASEVNFTDGTSTFTLTSYDLNNQEVLNSKTIVSVDLQEDVGADNTVAI